jgi:hypothetical protein
MPGKLHAAPFEATAFLHSKNVRLWVVSQKIFAAGSSEPMPWQRAQ